MTFLTHYIPPNPSLWQGRSDSLPAERFFQIVNLVDLTKHQLVPSTNLTFALLGFCCDVGVKRNLGRVGAKEGPLALRQALAKLPVHRNGDFTLFDVGNIACDDDDLESAQAALGNLVAKLLENKIIPIVIGGGHEIAFGHYCGIAEAFPKRNLGIINFDAHFDLRPYTLESRGNSGTPFSQIAARRLQAGFNFDYLCLGIQPLGNTKSLFQRAQELNVSYITAEEIHGDGNKNLFNQLDNFLNLHENIYLTLCMDVFAQTFAPGVSAPQPLGLFPQQVMGLLRHIVKSKRVISFDVAELSPPLDRDNITAYLAAAMTAEFLGAMT